MVSPTAPTATERNSLLAAGAAFTAGVLFGVRPRQPSALRTLAGIGAAALATLALIPSSEAAVRKVGARRRAGVLRFSLMLPRPVEQVFSLFADFENFPRLLESLERVVDYGDGRSHWCARTPAGNTIEWDTVTTKFVTNSVIGWQSIQGSEVQMKGLLRFSPESDGTCVRVVMEYEVTTSNLRDSLAALLMPRNAPRLEKQMRELAVQMASQPAALARELPPVITSDAATRRGYGADVTG